MPSYRSSYCDGQCNTCPIMNHPNSRLVSLILNELVEKLGFDQVHPIVQKHCPNLTCCFDCHIDDFCHVDSCKIVKRAKRFAKEG